jgi:hypothetical protein
MRKELIKDRESFIVYKGQDYDMQNSDHEMEQSTHNESPPRGKAKKTNPAKPNNVFSAFM